MPRLGPSCPERLLVKRRTGAGLGGGAYREPVSLSLALCEWVLSISLSFVTGLSPSLRRSTALHDETKDTAGRMKAAGRVETAGQSVDCWADRKCWTDRLLDGLNAIVL